MAVVTEVRESAFNPVDTLPYGHLGQADEHHLD
jgi:hypothetical protein